MRGFSLAVALLAAGGVPARVTYGLELEDGIIMLVGIEIDA